MNAEFQDSEDIRSTIVGGLLILIAYHLELVMCSALLAVWADTIASPVPILRQIAQPVTTAPRVLVGVQNTAARLGHSATRPISGLRQSVHPVRQVSSHMRFVWFGRNLIPIVLTFKVLASLLHL